MTKNENEVDTKLQQAFRSFEAVIMDTHNLRPASVSNVADIADEEGMIRILFDTKKARFSHLRDGDDTVNVMQKTLFEAGIKSEKIEDPEYKPEGLGQDNKPSLLILLEKNKESLEKISQAKEIYAAQLLDRMASSALAMCKNIFEDKKYTISKESAAKITSDIGERFKLLIK